MKKKYKLVKICLALLCLHSLLPAVTPSQCTNFITVAGDRLQDGKEPFRFISFNIPNLHCIEDYMAFSETNAWRFPDAFEVRDALQTTKLMGGTAVRIYTLTVQRKDDAPETPRYVLGPGQFNEEAFRSLDRMLAIANETGVRIIIPFVDNWSWMGGIAEYAGFRGKPAEAFWTDEEIKKDFKKTIAFILERVNTVTGVAYRDDKAILAWETGNELVRCPDAWTSEMLSYVKKLDPHHLVIDGYNANVLRDESLANPNVDIVTTHHYENDPRDMIEHIRLGAEKAKGKKPYLIGEFGFISSTAVAVVADYVIGQPQICGALIWSLRFHSRDGGFYWHSEPAAGGFYKAYHIPGFDSGESYDERQCLAVLRQKAYAIRHLAEPVIAAPQPPVLLPCQQPDQLTWQGSVFAESYVVERASGKSGPWQVVGRDISDAVTAHRPLFNDVHATIGSRYWYRVRAKNSGGLSQPSNVVGPMAVTSLCLVDELSNYGTLFSKKGNLTLQSEDARKFKEDSHRLVAEAGGEVVYHVPGRLQEARLYLFAAGVNDLPELALSADGREWQTIEGKSHSFFAGKADYNYLQPVLLSATATSTGQYVKIHFISAMQLARVELLYGQP